MTKCNARIIVLSAAAAPSRPKKTYLSKIYTDECNANKNNNLQKKKLKLQHSSYMRVCTFIYESVMWRSSRAFFLSYACACALSVFELFCDIHSTNVYIYISKCTQYRYTYNAIKMQKREALIARQNILYAKHTQNGIGFMNIKKNFLVLMRSYTTEIPKRARIFHYTRVYAKCSHTLLCDGAAAA